MLDKVKPAAIGARRASAFLDVWHADGAEDNHSQRSSQAIRAELSGSDSCTAAGIAGRGSSPVLALCRKLLEAGFHPDRPLHVYRGTTLALQVRSIGEAANLEVNGEGTGFRPRSEPGPASLVRKSPPALPSVSPSGRAEHCAAPMTLDAFRAFAKRMLCSLPSTQLISSQQLIAWSKKPALTV